MREGSRPGLFFSCWTSSTCGPVSKRFRYGPPRGAAGSPATLQGLGCPRGQPQELQGVAERLTEPVCELGGRETVVLRPVGFDLEGSHQRGYTARRLPVEALCNSMDQPGPVGVAAAGR